jgi:hypothetical protein
VLVVDDDPPCGLLTVALSGELPPAALATAPKPSKSQTPDVVTLDDDAKGRRLAGVMKSIGPRSHPRHHGHHRDDPKSRLLSGLPSSGLPIDRSRPLMVRRFAESRQARVLIVDDVRGP